MGIKGLVRHSQDYDKLTASQKRDLTQALDHNKYDVEALVVLLSAIQKEHLKRLREQPIRYLTEFTKGN